MPYTVEFSAHGARSFRKLSHSTQEAILPILQLLSSNPRPPGVKKLKETGDWRVRVGDYRIVYEIRDNTLHVLIVKIAHRSEAYK